MNKDVSLGIKPDLYKQSFSGFGSVVWEFMWQKFDLWCKFMERQHVKGGVFFALFLFCILIISTIEYGVFIGLRFLDQNL